MKRLIFIVCLFLFALPASAQQGNNTSLMARDMRPASGAPGGADYCADSYAGLVLDLNPHTSSYTDTGCTSAAGSTDAVACVTDGVGTITGVLQATADDRPILTADGNGWLYLDFDGTSDYLTESTFEPTTDGAQPFTVVMVAQAKGTATVNPLWAHGSTQGNYLQRDTRDYQLNFGTNLRQGDPDTDLHVHITEVNGASSAIYIDGTLQGSAGNAGTIAWVDGLFVGSSSVLTQFAFQRVYRMVAYNALLSSTDRDALDSCLTSLYATAPP